MFVRVGASLKGSPALRGAEQTFSFGLGVKRTVRANWAFVGSAPRRGLCMRRLRVRTWQDGFFQTLGSRVILAGLLRLAGISSATNKAI